MRHRRHLLLLRLRGRRLLRVRGFLAAPMLSIVMRESSERWPLVRL